ncbi:4'-phosphopantetheinyl transferase family protein [Rouxiella chamberiensis]|uniref:4'-phosphopantetheinyl transferase family protein n=1 Tax=Rouxiella chamberiensis TaxID=1513468 RepID=UPI000697B448|nr:4'-phosphopantetheinyl transferase superfamily protein [Rouxiella chamberiensis]
MLTPLIAVPHSRSAFIRSLQQGTLRELPWLMWTEVQFDLSHYDNALFAQYSLNQPAHLHRAVGKRRGEYLASRLAARTALQCYGIADFFLENDADRAPVWPQGIVGSLTHTATRAVILTARADCRHHVGVDAENLLKASSAQELASMIVGETEEALLQRCEMPWAAALTLAFSLKESLYKALYPHLKQFMSFHSARVIELNGETGHALLQLTSTLDEDYPAGRVFRGYFAWQEEHVLTVVVNHSNP